MVDFQDLPYRVRKRVVEFLDYGTRRTCRLVSQTLKENVDIIGHSLKIDSRVKQSTDLSKAVIVTEARILYMRNNKLGAEEIRNWKTLIISGPMDNLGQSWLNQRVCQNCTNLRILILNETSLVMEDFTRTQPESQYFFHHLSELHMIKYHTVLESSEPEWHEMLARLRKNVAFFLEVIRSRVLKLLYVNAGELEKEMGNLTNLWEHQPLFKFLDYHRNSLEILILPTLVFDEPPVPVDLGIMTNATQLKTIQLEAYEVNQKMSTYWRNLLLAQRSLEKLYVHAQHDLLPNESRYPWLPAVVSNNTKTLTTVRLTYFDNIAAGNFDNMQDTLDMRLFRSIESLRSLEICGSSLDQKSPLHLNYLNELPTKQLKKLVLCFTQIGEDFDGIEFLESFNPTTLILSKISTKGHFNDLNYTFQFLEKALRIRTLEDFKFSFYHIYWGLAKGEPVQESHLEPWMSKFEGESVPNLMAFWIASSKIDDISLVPREKQRYANTDYVEMLAMSWYGLREQPFNLPRNVESFSCWKWFNPHAPDYSYRGIQILPTTKPLFQRVIDIGQLDIHVHVALEWDENNPDAPVGPVGLEDLGVSNDILESSNGVVRLFFTRNYFEYKCNLVPLT